MKKITFLMLSSALLLSTGLSSVSAADSVDKTANVTIQAGTIDLTVDNNIDFGIVPVTGVSQTKANIGQDINVNVSDALGDASGWDVRLNVSSLQTPDSVVLEGQQFNYDPSGSSFTGAGVAPSANVTGVTPGTDIELFTGDASSTTGAVAFSPGFLDLVIGGGAQAGTYTGTATFSVVTNP